MQVVVAERGKGKTTNLIVWASQDSTNRIIIVHDRARASIMKASYPHVKFRSLSDLKEGKLRGQNLQLGLDDCQEFFELPVFYRNMIEIVSINGESVALNVLDEVRKLL